MTSNPHDLRNRARLLVSEVRHLLRSERDKNLVFAQCRRPRLSQLEDRLLMSASPVAVVAEYAAATFAEVHPVADVTADSEAADAILQPTSFIDAPATDGPLETIQDSVDEIAVVPAEEAAAQADELLAELISTVAEELAEVEENSAKADESEVQQTLVRGPELIVIDYRVQDADGVLAELLNTDRDFRLLRLDGDSSGLQQIADKLQQLNHVSAIHLLTHGTNAEIWLGGTQLNGSTLPLHAAELTAWQQSLTADADLLIYGCDVAETVAGTSFLDRLSQLTGADIAASTDETGSSQLGGDWDLEYQTGLIQTDVAISLASREQWNSLLAFSTYRDEFNAVSFSNSDGSQDWSVNPWQELTESNGSATGDIRITSHMDRDVLQVSKAGSSISRQLNLLGADTARLSFDYAYSGLGTNQFVNLQVSSDGSTWTTLAALGDTTDATEYQFASFDLAPYIDSDTQIRFVVEGNGTSFFVDNIQVAYTTISPRVSGELAIADTANVNQITSGQNRGSAQSVAMAPNGDYVVVWTEVSSSGNLSDVYAQQFNANGTARFPAFRVNAAAADEQRWASVAVDGSGRFAVVWTSEGQDSSEGGIYLRRFNSDGSAIDSVDVLVNAGSVYNDESNASIAMNAQGDLVVAYEDSDGSTTTIFVRQFSMSAAGSVTQFPTSAITVDSGSNRRNPSVDINSDGEFVVAWQRDKKPHLQRFNADGSLKGGRIDISPLNILGGTERFPVVAIHDSGELAVAYRSEIDGFRSVWVKHYRSDGTAYGVASRVADESGDATQPSIAKDAAGNIAIAWESTGDADGKAVYVRQYDASRSAVGAAVLVNSTGQTGDQSMASVAMISLDRYVVTWSGPGTDGSSAVFARQVNAAPAENSVSLAAVADTYITKGDSSDNYGDSSSLVVDLSGGDIGDGRALLRFDLSTIPTDATITGATLKLNSTQNGGVSSLSVYEVTESWVEGTGAGTNGVASWDERLPGIAWNSVGGSYNPSAVATLSSDSTGQHIWNITPLAQAWFSNISANNGLIIGSTDKGGATVTYDSREGSTPPTLEITYTLPDNRDPIAVAAAIVQIAEGQSVLLDGTASSDPDSDSLTYEWDLNYDGMSFVADVTGATSTVTWNDLRTFGIDDDGTYQVALRVFDGTNYSAVVQQVLSVTNSAPVLTVTGANNAVSGSDYTLNLQAVDPGNDTISGWVINWGDGHVQTVAGNVTSVTHAYTTAGLTNSITVSATDEDGTYTPSKLYVTSFQSNQLFQFDGSTGQLLGFANAVAGPVDIVVGPDGLLYVSQFGANKIDRYDAVTGALIDTFVYRGSGGVSGPSRMAFGTDGNLYVTSYITSEVVKYSGSDGRFLGTAVLSGAGGLSEPDGLAIAADGTLYVASATDGAIRRYNGSTGQYIDTFASFGTATYVDLEFAGNGNLLASSTTLNVVREFDITTGSVVRDVVAAGSGGVVSVAGIRTGPDGSLYVADNGSGRILQYTQAGVFVREVVTAGSGLNQPVDLVFAPSLQVRINAAPTAQDDAFALSEGGSLSVPVEANWFNSNWGSRRQIVIDNSSLSSDVTDAVVLVRLHATATDAIAIDYSQTQNFGEDLRFVDASGNILAHEIETWDESGYSSVWVRIPEIATAAVSNNIWMYYNNSAAVDGGGRPDVWKSTDIAVLHLNGTVVDSTSNQNHGALTNVFVAPGVVGSSGLFDGADSRLNLGSDDDVDNLFAGGGTISAWIRPEGWGENGYGRIASKASTTFAGGENGDGWAWQVGGSGTAGFLLFEQGFTGGVGEWRTATGSINLNSWQHVVIVYDSSSPSNSPQIYVDGVLQTLISNSAPGGTARSDAALNFTIGNHALASTRTFDGRIDELRISRSLMTADEVAVQFASVNGGLVSGGSLQSGPSGLLGNDADADSDRLQVSLVSGPTHAAPGGFVLNSDGSFSYTHDGSETTTDSFVYSISDGFSQRTATVNLSIAPVNDNAPVINSNGGGDNAALNVVEGLRDVTTVVASDVDNAATALSYSIAGGADAAMFQINAITGVIQFASAPVFASPEDANSDNVYEVVVRASDGTFVDEQSLSVSVTNRNDAPIALDDVYSTNEDVPLAIAAAGVLANDSDPDSDSLTAVLVNDVAHGSLTLNANGSFVYTPNTNFSGTDSFSYRATDGNLVSSVATVTIGVNAINDAPIVSVPTTVLNYSEQAAPIAVGDGLTINDADSHTISSARVVITGGSATDSDELLFTSTGLIVGTYDASSRTLTLSGTASLSQYRDALRSVTYRNPGDTPSTALRTVTFTVSDGIAEGSASRQLQLTAVNDRPVVDAGADRLIHEGSTLSLDASGASDPDGDSLTFEWDLNNDGDFSDAGGAVTTVTWAQLSSVLTSLDGTHLVTVRVTDAGGLSATDSFELTINQRANVAFAADSVDLVERTTVTGDVRVGQVVVTDDGFGTNSIALSGGDAARFFVDAAGVVFLRPGTVPDFDDQTAFTFRVQVDDPAIAGSPDRSTEVSLAITDVNHAPTSTALADITVNEDASVSAIFTASAFSDSDQADTLTYSMTIVSDPDDVIRSARINAATGRISWALNTNANGLAVVRVTAADNSGLSTSQQFTINVMPVDNTPTARDASYQTNAGQALVIAQIPALHSGQDADGQATTIEIVSQPAFGNLIANPDGTFTYQSDAGSSGIDSFDFRVSDGTLISDVATVTIEVRAVVVPVIVQSERTSSQNAVSERSSTDQEAASNTGAAKVSAAAADDVSQSASVSASILNQHAVAARNQDSENEDDQSIVIAGELAEDNESAVVLQVSAGFKKSLNLDSVVDSGELRGLNDISESRFDRSRINTQAQADLRTDVIRVSLLDSMQRGPQPVSLAERLEEDVNRHSAIQSKVAGSVQVVASGLSVGYVIWVLRGGMLLTGLLAQMPAWRMVDPLMVIDASEGGDDGESLQTILNDQEAILKRSSRDEPLTATINDFDPDFSI